MYKVVREYGSTAGILIAGALIVAWLLNPSPHPLEGQMAPHFELADLSGETASLDQHLGKDIVVLDFWATWCPPCRKGMPILDAVADHFADQPVAIYGVNIQESPEQVKRFTEAGELNLPILMDETGIVAEDYGVTGIPQTVVIDKSGRIRTIIVGVGPRFEQTLRREIQALLDGIPPAE